MRSGGRDGVNAAAGNDTHDSAGHGPTAWLKRTFHRFRWYLLIGVLIVVAVVTETILVEGPRSKQGLVFTTSQSALWALIILTVILMLLDILVRGSQGDKVQQRQRGVKGLVVGTDLRVSTSKLQAALWTGTVLYAFIFFLLLGHELISPFGCGDHHPKKCSPPDVSAYHGIYDKVANADLKPEYFALLGLPLAAAIAAKALTTNKVANGDLLKQTSNTVGLGSGAAEVITDDAGNVDLLDFQYAAFNLLLLIYFFIRLFGHAADGLPTLPPTLLALSGVSVGAYTFKKALETGVGPAITNVSPPMILLGTNNLLTVYGDGFVTAGRAATDRNKLFLDGKELGTTTWTETSVAATLDTDLGTLKQLGFRAISNAQLIVYDDTGQPSAPYPPGIDIQTPPTWPS